MTTEKKSKSEIIRKIVELIADKPYSMYELSKELGSNWDTIKSNIDLLIDLKVVEMNEQKVYLRKDCLVDLSTDSIAGIPLSKEVRKKVYALAKKITDQWKKMTGEFPSKTQLQKSLVEIAEKFSSLNLPRGWYFYGKVVLVKVDQKQLLEKPVSYNFSDLNITNTELNQAITDVVNKISPLSISKLLDYQYNKYERKDYMIKRDIQKLFLEEGFNKKEFANLLYQLIFNFKVDKQSQISMDIIDTVKEASSVLIKQAFDTPIDKHPSLKYSLLETFSIFWKIYATYVLFESLEGDIGYDKRIIQPLFMDRINFYKKDLADSFSGMSSFVG